MAESFLGTAADLLSALSCPCIIYSSNHSRLIHLTATGECKFPPTDLENVDVDARLTPPASCPPSFSPDLPANPSPQHIGLFCALYAISPQFFGVGQVMMQCFSRLQTRQRYGIRGDVVQDALVGTFPFFPSFVCKGRGSVH